MCANVGRSKNDSVYNFTTTVLFYKKHCLGGKTKRGSWNNQSKCSSHFSYTSATTQTLNLSCLSSNQTHCLDYE